MAPDIVTLIVDRAWDYWQTDTPGQAKRWEDLRGFVILTAATFFALDLETACLTLAKRRFHDAYGDVSLPQETQL